jgi:hypothetical protein
MRLVAFGCSFTYGVGLRDCFILPDEPGLVPSKFSWPQLVANELNMDCINMSRPGSSNKEILNTLLNFKFNSTDVVVIMWSFLERWCKIKNYTSIDRLTQTSEGNDFNNILSQYDKVFTFEDMQLDFIYRANFAKLYLDNKNLKNYHLSANPPECCPKVMPVWNTVNFSNLSMCHIAVQHPPALDIANGNPHPGPGAHRIVAMGLCDEISNAHNK